MPLIMKNVPDPAVPDQKETSSNLSEQGNDAGEEDNFKAGKVYPGDLVVYKSKHPWDWSPTYGTVVLPQPLRPATATVEQEKEALKNPSDTLDVQVSPEKSSRVLDNDRSRGTSRTGSKSEVGQNGPNFAVHWDSSNRIRQMKRNEVCIIDRMLVRGTRVKNNDGVNGTIVNYNVKATLQLVGTNHVIENVPITDLTPISYWVRGQEVLYKNWVGLITNVKRKIWFKLDGGMTFHVETTESDGFMKTDPYWGLGVACPGVRTPFSPTVLKNAKWTAKYMRFLWKWVPPISFLYSFTSATVIKVEATAVTIKWLAPAPNTTNYSDVPPPVMLDKSQLQGLQVLSMPSSEYAGLNSVRLYSVKPEDELTTYASWFSRFRQKFMDPAGSQQYSNAPEPSLSTTIKPVNLVNEEAAVKIILRHNYVDVAWDNDKTERLASIDVPQVYEPKSHEHLRSGMVVVSDLYLSDSERYGVIQNSEDLVEQGTFTVRVHWFCEGTQKNRVVQDEGVTEEPIYSVFPHSKYSLFQRGTVLFSTDSQLHEFDAGVVLDVDVSQGNMVIYCTDGRYRKVWPHMVSPFSKRCTWNFFTRKWVVDDIIPPPQQLGLEQYPKCNRMSSKAVEALLSELNDPNKPRGLWEAPQFDILETAPESHWFYKPKPEYVPSSIGRTVRKEFDTIREGVPDGAFIRVFEDRMDLISVLLVGPSKTPYEDCILMFDLKLPRLFPKAPPQVHFISYFGEIHPLISEDGNFCAVNMEWKYSGTGDNEHEPSSYILEAVRRLQGLFFTREPYFGDAEQTHDPETLTAEQKDKSRGYNEMVLLQSLDIYYQALLLPHAPWAEHILDLAMKKLPKKAGAIENWLLNPAGSNESSSHASQSSRATSGPPSFPLLPLSKGFRIAFERRLKTLRSVILSAPAAAPAVVPAAAEQVEEEKELPAAKTIKSSSPSRILSTIEEFLHEQTRDTGKIGTTKGKMDKDDEREVETKGESSHTRFRLADI